VNEWNPALYQGSHAFVYEHGRGLVELLAPRPGEQILDAGCGTGQLTNEIAKSGAIVQGIDNSSAMVEQARKNYPEIEFRQADLTELPFGNQFDGVFSNAVLHWVKEAERAAASIHGALKPGGRFVAEFGGYGNTRAFLQAIWAAMQTLGFERVHPWYYPTVGEYATVLERQGFEVRLATLFDRPIALEDGENGLARWIEMFGGLFLLAVGEERKQELIRRTEQQARPLLYADGGWKMDYRRLRVVAFKAAPAS
jgi:trans-aconitate 2-methyltransferase